MLTSEHTLLEQSIQGNGDAFGELVRRHEARLLAAMRRLVVCTAEAEDIVQEAFLLAYRNLPKFRATSAFYTWLYRIARNRAVSRRRRARPTQSLSTLEEYGFDPIASPGGTAAQSLESAEQRALVRIAMGRLSHQHRTVLLMRTWRECDYETIAVSLGVKVGTVKSRLHRARLGLRDELRKLR